MRVVKSENGNKKFKTTVSQRGEDVYGRPNRQSQHAGGKVRGMSPVKGFHYVFASDEEQVDEDNSVYTTFAFKKQRKDQKKNKSRRDRIFVE